MPALARRPADSSGAEFKLFNWFTRARGYYFSQPRLPFEAMTFGLALLFGLLLMPALIYLAGRYTLSPYSNGGFFSLYGDFYGGLVEPRQTHWLVVIGPFVFLTLFRIFRFILRKI
jgi:hypothetical protein